MLGNRIIVLLAGIVLAYFAVYAGDAFRNLGIEWLWVVCATVLAITGVICFCWRLEGANRYDATVNDFKQILCSAACAISLACCFGLIAQPIDSTGAYPWHWPARWAILTFFAVVPLFFDAKEIGADYLRERPASRQADTQGKVTAIRK